MSRQQRLPGLDVIGCGYQTVDGQFASVDSCEEQLFDFDKIASTELTPAATGKIYSFPTKFVQYLDKNIRESQTVSGDTVEDFVNKLSTSVDIQASYAGFGGSVKTEFRQQSEYNRFESFTRLQYNTTFWRLKLDDSAGDARDFLKDYIRGEIDTIDPNDLYEKYGTHYVNGISVGGRCVTSAITNKLTCSKKESFGVYLTAKYEVGAFGASSDVTKDDEYKKFTENSTFKTTITGGDPSVYGLDSSPKFEEWAKTVKDHPMLIDFDSRHGLIPIWKLAKTEERKKLLKDAMDEYFKTHKIGFNIHDGPVLEGRWVPGRIQHENILEAGINVYSPDLSEGWYWLGQRVIRPNDPTEGMPVEILAVRPKPWAKGVLSPISSYAKICDLDLGMVFDEPDPIEMLTDFVIPRIIPKFHITTHCAAWRPVPEQPVDYAPLGHFLVWKDNSQPKPGDTSRLMAVHSEFITQSNVGIKIYSNNRSGSCWRTSVPNEGLELGCFYGHNADSEPPTNDVFCLKKSAIEFVQAFSS